MGYTCSTAHQTAAPVAGDICPTGKFCPEASSVAMYCPPGRYSSTTGGVNEQSCTMCPSGKACVAGSVDATTSCQAGYYCLPYTRFATETPCPDGYMTISTSLASKASCTVCDTTGSYCLQGASTVTPCEKGYFCSTTGSGVATVRKPCPAGSYSASGASSCTDCDKGYICPDGFHEFNPIKCPAGTYMDVIKSSGPCLPCVAGYDCSSSGTLAKTPCPSGKWSYEGADTCGNCPAGYYCDNTGVLKDCPLGSFCVAGSSSSAASCTAGYYCPLNSKEKYPCPPGTYSADGASVCTQTEAGYYTAQAVSGATKSTQKCLGGYYCEAGSKGKINKPCPAGTLSSEGSSDPACTACTQGYYCPIGSSGDLTGTSKVICPTGYFCPTGSAAPTKCPRGKYNPSTGGTDSTSCKDCDPGKVCTQDGLSAPDMDCDPGYYCEKGASTSQPSVVGIGGLCTAGAYCTKGVAAPIPCSSGTFNVFTGCRAQTDCLQCPFGFICDDSAGGTLLSCPVGYYCPLGTYTAIKKVPPGGTHAILGQGAPVNCLPGTYASTPPVAGPGATTCDPCLQGNSCQTSSVITPTPCDLGKYCPTGTILPYYCPEGTFRSTVGAKQLSECSPCTASKYCNSIGLSSETGDCDAGFFCEFGAFHSNPGYTISVAIQHFGPCPVGNYCPKPSTLPTACGTGKYYPALMAQASTDCFDCIPGKYCLNTVNENPTDNCDAGYYCPYGSSNKQQNQCQAGYYCLLGSPNQLKCPGGTYQPAAGQSTCINCPKGYYCPPGTGALTDPSNACPLGYYCPDNTADYKKFPCPPGTYGAATKLQIDTDCTNCDVGKYCTAYAQTATTGNCATGFYCLGKTRFSTPVNDVEGKKCTAGEICVSGVKQNCPANYVCNTELMSSATLKCNDGFYCGTSITLLNPEGQTGAGLCNPGRWCKGGVETQCNLGEFLPSKGAGAVSGATECLTCSLGSYCASTGLFAPTAVCQKGYYCLSGQQIDTDHLCTKGFSCPVGSFQIIPCDPGMYQPNDGKDTCINCVAGNFCLFSSTAGTISMTTCPTGYKCPSNNLDYAVPCDVGSYQTGTGSTGCTSCSQGNYCDRMGMSAMSGCPAGYYCPAGTTNGKINICQPGYYCPANSNAPTPCTAGKYCSDYGLSAESGICEAGYYCISGAKVPNPTDGTTGNICPQGYYCPDGLQKLDCAVGTYNDLQGSNLASDCKICPVGKVCTTLHLSYPTTDCLAGKYCPFNQPSVDCDIGYMCPSGTTEQIKCLPGTYQTQTGKSSCDPCPAGKYCNYDLTGITVAIDCPKGYYCGASTADYQMFPCPEGTFDNVGLLTAVGQCKDCTVNKYCIDKALQAESGDCRDGYLCPTKSTVPALDGNKCNKNYFCVAGVKTECSLITYTFGVTLGATSAADCMKCLPGNMCTNHDTGMTTCPSGFICKDGVKTSCTAGKYCPASTLTEKSCLRGTYSGSGQGSCTTCDLGKYCPSIGASSPTNCDVNMYCGTGAVKPIPCDNGKYSNSNTCTDCPSGQWCWKSATGNIKGTCSAGYICYSGADSPTPFFTGIKASNDANLNYNGKAARGCYTSAGSGSNSVCLPGTYMPSMGATACFPCPPGYYCNQNGMFDLSSNMCINGYVCKGNTITATPNDATGAPCSVFKYCPDGTSTELSCADGTVTLSTGKSFCSKCDEGYSCTSSAPHSACATGNTNCREGTGTEPLCPPGTYSNIGSCSPCPAGLFCIDGRSEAAPGDCSHYQCCVAGYFCTGGSPSPTPSGVGGKQCAAGYYCPQGATSLATCPANKYIFKEKARQASDCSDCMEGYICQQGSATYTACPKGQYCPTGITGSLPCPKGTYSGNPQNKIVHDCTSCDKGYFCSSTGLTTEENSACPMGNYCLQRATSGIPCPYSTYLNKTGAKDVTECKKCPLGYYCSSEGQTNGTETPCIGGQLCEDGTSQPEVCPEKYYCNETTNYQKVICPVNYYCPPNSTVPTDCKTGEYCPIGSGYPIKCISGQISQMIDGALVCQDCPAGTYSVSGFNSKCETCEPGYVCLGATNAKYPWNKVYHNGYKCPRGYYCPAGSKAPTPCPAGTYNPDEGQVSPTACILCAKNTFGNSAGQSACLACGESAFAEEGWTECKCKGKNRAFLVSDSSCPCKPFYSMAQGAASSGSSDADCQPKLYPRCSETEVITPTGECKKVDDCSAECPGSSGKRSRTLGTCECKNVQKLDTTCNKDCRQSQPQLWLGSDGKIRVNAAGDDYNYSPTYLSPKTIANFTADFLKYQEGKDNKIRSVQFSSAGRTSARYGPTPGIAGEYTKTSSSGRRLLIDDTTNPPIYNPVMCIHVVRSDY